MSENMSTSTTKETSHINTAAIGIDFGLVILFAAIGYQTHANELTFNGVVSTAWPFVLALLAAHALLIALRQSATRVLSGVTIWLITVIGGMTIRQITGDGTATAFVVVATLFNATTLLGWRLLAALVARRRSNLAA